MSKRLSRRGFLALGAAAAAMVPLRDASAQILSFRGDETISNKGWYLPPSPYNFLGAPNGSAENHIASRVTLGEPEPVCPDEEIPLLKSPADAEYLALRRCFREADQVASTHLYLRHLNFVDDPVYRTDLDETNMLRVWTGLSSGQVLDITGATLMHQAVLNNTDGSTNIIRWWFDYPGQPTGSWVVVTALQHPVFPNAFWWQIEACKWGVEDLDGFQAYEYVQAV